MYKIKEPNFRNFSFLLRFSSLKGFAIKTTQFYFVEQNVVGMKRR